MGKSSTPSSPTRPSAPSPRRTASASISSWLNGIQTDWPLQIGQKLLIHGGNVTPSPTPRPLTPIEKLTPQSDGKYYHIIKSGETLSWIADLYKIKVNDLMAWNDLNASSILQPKQKLVLQVTPPATQTPTPGPATATPTATPCRQPPPLPWGSHARPSAQRQPSKLPPPWIGPRFSG